MKQMEDAHTQLQGAIKNFFRVWKAVCGCPDTDTIACECSEGAQKTCTAMLDSLQRFTDTDAAGTHCQVDEEACHLPSQP